MRNKFIYFLLLSVLFGAVINNAFAQTHNRILTSEEMKKDLEILRNIHEVANSGLYYYRSKSEMDSLYNWAHSMIEQPMQKTDFFKIVVSIADFEGSVHNYTELDLNLKNYLEEQKTFFPYPLRFIEGHIIFDGINATIPPGSRILRINDVDASEIMQSLYKYFSADGFTKTKKISGSVERGFDLEFVLEYGLKEKYEIEFLAPYFSIPESVTVPAVTLAEKKEITSKRFSSPVMDKIDFKSQDPYSFEMLEDSIGLLNLRWFGFVTGEEDPKFPDYVSFLDSVFVHLHENSIPHLIIDVRNNPGGSDPTFEQPVMYLTERSFKENEKAHIIFDPQYTPFPEYFWGVTTTERIDEEFWKVVNEFLKERYPVFDGEISLQDQKFNPTYYPKKPQFNGNVYLLINENVGSASSHFASLVKGFVDNVIVVGVESVGGYYVHNGHVPFVYELPHSKIKTQFSIVHVLQDAPQLADQPDGRGIIPDYEVWPTLSDYFEQKDTQMNFVLELIKENHFVTQEK